MGVFTGTVIGIDPLRSSSFDLTNSYSGAVGIAKGVDGLFEHEKVQFVLVDDNEPELMSEVSGSLNVSVGKDDGEDGVHIVDVTKSKFISSEMKNTGSAEGSTEFKRTGKISKSK